MRPPWFLVLASCPKASSLPGWMSKLCADRRVPFSRIRRGCHVLGRAKDQPAPGTRDEPRASRPGDVGSRPTEGDDEAVASQASHAGSPESLTRLRTATATARPVPCCPCPDTGRDGRPSGHASQHVGRLA